METKGIIEKIHFNGKISYLGMECRADGILLDNDNTSIDNDEDIREDDEEAVIGKGFDYHENDDSDDMGDFDENDIDDFDEIDGDDDDVLDSDASFDNKQKQDMLHFSKIPSTMLNNKQELAEKYPKFDSSCESIIQLDAGQSLYLPAGWFHEVQSLSSCSSDKNMKESGLEECHAAINYWYHPPDVLSNYDFPYKDRTFWSRNSKK